jgi:hypothetical protein
MNPNAQPTVDMPAIECRQPDCLLPFKTTGEECSIIFENWLRKKWFVPSMLKRSAATSGTFKGVYLPFWAYDVHTRTDYKGESSVNRTVHYTNAKGKTAVRTETQWHAANGSIDLAFDEVMVPASQTLPASIVNRLNHWDMENCVTFREELLAGFITETCQRDSGECFPDAQKKMESTLDEDIRKEIGGDKQRIHSKNTGYKPVKYKHLLLPVWMTTFRFNQKYYPFVVSGRTGEVMGDCPKSITKIGMIALAVIAATASLIYFLL